jgi:tetratricopeptide (TPR) repeat protein
MADLHDLEENQTFTENGPDEEPHAERDLYQEEIDRFQSALEEDTSKALERFGFSLFHSLPGMKQIELAQKLNIDPRTGLDFYNLASLHIEHQEYDKAAKQLKKALELKPEFPEATYNLALCYENMGKKKDAIELWRNYLELEEVPEDREAVEAHLAELTS